MFKISAICPTFRLKISDWLNRYVIRGLLIALISLLFAAALFTSASAEERCGSFMQLTKEYAAEFGPMFDSYTLQVNGSAEALILIFHETQSSALKKWILLTSVPGESNVGNYCLKSSGIEMVVLADIPDNATDKRYGMPGSGYPRCSSFDEVPGGLFLRLWANREMGKSTMVYFGSKESSSYSVVFANDGPWILIEQEKSGRACYYMRGETVPFKLNLSVR